MLDKITIDSVMTKNPKLIEASSLMITARNIMYDNNFRHLPVTAKGKIYGIISDRDIQLASSIAKKIIDDEEILVGDVCIVEPYIVKESALVGEVAEQMCKRHIGSAIVVKDDKITGIFTTTDVCRVLGEISKKQKEILDKHVVNWGRFV